MKHKLPLSSLSQFCCIARPVLVVTMLVAIFSIKSVSLVVQVFKPGTQEAEAGGSQ